jgi:uncharacterized delta-60 repeat protein
MKSTLLLLVFLFLNLSSLLAQDGALDLTFNTTGYVKTSLSTSYDTGKSVAIQSDGKIVIVGYISNGNYSDFGVIRYNSDGTIDTGFGTNGKVTTSVSPYNDSATGVAIQSDGKIVVVGPSSNSNNSSDFAVVRYTSTGALDNTFNSNGIVITPMASNDDDLAYSVAIQPDDQKIVVAGFARLRGSLGGNYDFAVARYNSDGSLDTNFGTALNGKVTTDFGSTDIGYSVAIHGGKIVVAGYARIGTTEDFAVARYNSDGTLDNTFGTGGKVTTAIGTGDDRGYSVAIQSDEKIVVAGYARIGSTDDFAVVRYNSDGSLDNTFGTGGKVTTAFGTGTDWGFSVAIQSDGKIVVVGFASMDYANIAVVRYTDTGALDNTFGTGGKVTTAVGSSGCAGSSVAIQSDGKIVVGGYSNNGFSDQDFAVVRYTGTTPIANALISPKAGESTHPLHYQLEQNYPNPFNNKSTIGYNIPKTSFVSLSVYDIFGKEIKVFVHEEKVPGHYEIVFDSQEFVS